MSKKQGYVISDLHIGGGTASGGLDSFTQDETFVQFVEEITSPDTTLLINGDFIDFVQIPPYDHPDEPSYLLWTEAVSATKLAHALAAHPQCFDALRKFVKDGGGTLSIGVGNHDLDWVWPEVQGAFRHAMADPPPERLQFAVDRAQVYERVHIEHGHSFTPENCPVDEWDFVHRWPDEPAGTRYLERVWGTDFMLHWWNETKTKYRYADCVKPITKLIFDGPISLKDKARELVRMVLFLRRAGIPWTAVTSKVLAKPKEVDLFECLLAAVDPEDANALEELVGTVAGFEDAVRSACEDLSEEELAILAVTGEKVRLPPLGPEMEEVKTLGIVRPPPEERKAAEILRDPDRGITHVVFGHTHAPVDGNALGKGAKLYGCWFNTGTWQPFLNLKRTDVKMKVKASGITYEMLEDEGLYDVSLRAVRIRPNPPNRATVELIPIG